MVELLIDIEHLTTQPDPYAAHAALRERGIHELADGRWIVAAAIDVEQILADPSAMIGFEPTDPAGSIQCRMARFSDGEDHVRRRSVATSRLDLLDADRLRQSAAELTASMLPRGGETDIMESVARFAPVAALAAALGAHEGAVEQTRELAAAIAPPRGQARGDADEPMRQLCSLLGLDSQDDADLNIAALLFQTIDATAGLIGNSLLASTRFGVAEIFDGADGAGGRTAAFVREVSRFDPAVHFTARQTASTIDVTGHRVPPGASILVDLAAADRDPARWDDPDAFRPGRHGSSLAFGSGAHCCPGRVHALALATGIVEGVLAGGGRCVTTATTYEPRFNLRVPEHVLWSR